MLPFELAVSSKGHSIIECVQFQFQPRHFKVVLCLFVLDSCVDSLNLNSERFSSTEVGTTTKAVTLSCISCLNLQMLQSC